MLALEMQSKHTVLELMMSNITLRDHFAGLAMQGLLSADENFGWAADICASVAYEQADAMIVERNKHHKEHHETFGEEV
jgi:hypothetical protein